MKRTGPPTYLKTPAELRAWLERHHADETGVWLLFYKKHTGKPSLTMDEAIEEALCFGWIDSVLDPIDEESFALRFTPRRRGSNWSARNRRRVAALIEQGRMADPGLAAVEEAKRTGKWSDD